MRLDPLDIILRLVVAAAVGAAVGLERQRRNHPAGLRTHTLVCLGSALVMVMSEDVAVRYMDRVNADPARIAAQVVSGIGFLGAGTIMREGLTVRGLTTAASLWVVAALGLAVGGGFYLAAFTATLIALFVLGILNRLEYLLPERGHYGRLQVVAANRPGAVTDVVAEVAKLGGNVRSLHVEPLAEETKVELEMTVFLPRGVGPERVGQNVLAVEGVERMEFESA